MSAEFDKLLPVLVGGGVEFVVIGGVAGIIHGSARLTYDVDVVYSRTSENIQRLAATLLPYSPYLRGAPPGLPFTWDARTIQNGLNFTLTTGLGDLDLFGDATGGGRFEELVGHAFRIEAFGVEFLCLGLEKLIHIKRAAGRPKDFEAIAELEVLLEERQTRE